MRFVGKSVWAPFWIIIFVFAILNISGCYLFDNPIVVMWTNHPELAAYVENYNSTQDKYKVEIVYQTNPGKALLEENSRADLVVGPYLNSPDVIDKFNPINRLFKEKKINSDIFYHKLLEMCFVDKSYKVLPVSFNLPTVVFKRGKIEQEIGALSISLDEMKKLGGAFNKKRSKRVLKVGFSPYWNEDFLYYTALLFGANFRLGSGGRLLYDEYRLGEAKKFVSEWEKKTNFGFDDELKFREKYFTVPYYKLLLNDRILFYVITSSEIMDIPEENRTGLDFRWLSYRDNIAVMDDIVFIGVPLNAKNKKGAEDFITWFFTLDNQRKMLKMNSYKRLRAIGICNGFSSIVEINERDLPKNNEILIGHIPPGNFLGFPSPKGVDWERKKKKVILKHFNLPSK